MIFLLSFLFLVINIGKIGVLVYNKEKERNVSDMNFYDKVHELVRSFKQTNEYQEYLKLKAEIKLDEKLNKMVKDFKEKQQELQIKHINGTSMTEEEKQSMENLYSIVIQNEQARKLFEYEMKLDVMLADMQKIVAEGIKELVEF